MSNYRRPQNAGGLYFFTLVTAKRRPLFADENVRRTLRHAVETVRQSYPFTIHAWVLLPDHMHCIWGLPIHDTDFSKRWALIKAHVSQRYNSPTSNTSKRRRHERDIWQRRFWEHRLRDDEDYRRHMDYVHWNPVKHGLVRTVVEWPWSSFHRLVREGVYPGDWGTADQSGEGFGE
ncbi:transposase [Pseudomonas sp. GV071]|jgi:putative transposase|uniref:REP-associated tyrosine transposase n=1 Tax=Pseudomonas sp. GV071 TaxID=2135754 RepID=UPI000D338565|nr:transposase [Pseudomonas sp. GV071]PTQ72326.1 putative transposase [Pseudomonas sp. GV071]